MQMRDELGTSYEDTDFAELFKSRGQPAEAPWRLALVTLMHYAQGLTDRQAADAVRTRIDWKYVLSLELTDTGCDFSVLSEFRSRRLAHGAERRLFDLLLEQCRARGWMKARGKQRTSRPTCSLPCARFVGSTVSGRPCVMPRVSWPKVLQIGCLLTWTRCGRNARSTAGVDFRLPKDEKKRVELAETIGADGRQLLEEAYAESTLPWVRDLEAIQTLRRV